MWGKNEDIYKQMTDMETFMKDRDMLMDELSNITVANDQIMIDMIKNHIVNNGGKPPSCDRMMLMTGYKRDMISKLGGYKVLKDKALIELKCEKKSKSVLDDFK